MPTLIYNYIVYHIIGKNTNKFLIVHPHSCRYEKLNFKVTKMLDAKVNNIHQVVNFFLQQLDEYAVGLFSMLGTERKSTKKLHYTC